MSPFQVCHDWLPAPNITQLDCHTHWLLGGEIPEDFLSNFCHATHYLLFPTCTMHSLGQDNWYSNNAMKRPRLHTRVLFAQ
jgi:hypothetical protein